VNARPGDHASGRGSSSHVVLRARRSMTWRTLRVACL